MVSVGWPTVITPYQADGLNDAFVADIDTTMPIKVFNRFGNLVYQGCAGWNGRLDNGQIAMPGVYYYHIELPEGQNKIGTIEVYK